MAAIRIRSLPNRKVSPSWTAGEGHEAPPYVDEATKIEVVTKASIIKPYSSNQSLKIGLILIVIEKSRSLVGYEI